MNPLLSIVIANYNYGRFLEEAIQSVISQGMGDKVEIIICDAASTDNSVEIIKRYADGLPPNISYSQLSTNDQSLTTKITWWCTEPDGGQSDAFNKGFSHAQGRFLTWLNADDVFMPGALKAFEQAFTAHPECQWFVGGVMWLSKDMRIVKCGRGRPFSLERAQLGSLSVWGPSSIFSKDIYSLVGGVDERFVYTMDTDLWLKFAHKANVRYLNFADYAWGLRLHENAKMSGHNFSESEHNQPNHPRWAQLKREQEWRNKVFKPKHDMTFWRKLKSVCLVKSIMSRIDTIRFRGLYYKDYFK